MLLRLWQLEQQPCDHYVDLVWRPYSCSNGQFLLTIPSTQSDPESRYCSMAFLTFGVDQTYEYFHCGPEAATAHLLAFPTAALTITTSTMTSPSSTTTPTTTFASSPTSAWTSSTASSTAPAQTPAPGQPVASYPPSTTTHSTNAKSNTGSIIGGVIGGLALICCFGGLVAYLLVKSRTVKGGTRHQMTSFGGRPSPLHKTSQGGWGPIELPSNDHVRSPVELPSDNFR